MNCHIRVLIAFRMKLKFHTEAAAGTSDFCLFETNAYGKWTLRIKILLLANIVLYDIEVEGVGFFKVFLLNGKWNKLIDLFLSFVFNRSHGESW